MFYGRALRSNSDLSAAGAQLKSDTLLEICIRADRSAGYGGVSVCPRYPTAAASQNNITNNSAIIYLEKEKKKLY